MADTKSPGDPLDILPAMLTLVLIQTGKLLRDTDSYHPRAFNLTRAKVNEFVPLANDRFHDALDEIEAKIIDAKSVMEHDLSAIRKRRARRLGIQAASKTASPIAQDAVAVEKPEDPSLDVAPSTEIQPNSDAVLPPGVTEATLNLASGDLDQQILEDAIMVNGQDMPQDPVAAASGDSTGPKTAVGDTATKTPAETAENGKQQEKGKEPETADTQNPSGEMVNFDLDSMFDDSNMASMDDPINFDIDFSMPDAGSQNALGGGGADGAGAGGGDNPFGSINVSAVDFANSEDINSLLPDIDAMVNASSVPQNGSGDTTNATSITNNASGAAAPSGLSKEGTGQSEQDQQNQSTDPMVDDLFADYDFGDPAVDGDNAGTDLDLDWLKMQ